MPIHNEKLSKTKISAPETQRCIIVVAAIAASPFGIFISDEAADNDSIPVSSVIVAECIHCSSGCNNIVITTNSGFGFAARPRCY